MHVSRVGVIVACMSDAWECTLNLACMSDAWESSGIRFMQVTREQLEEWSRDVNAYIAHEDQAIRYTLHPKPYTRDPRPGT